MHAGYVMACLDGARGRHGRVDAPAHRGEDLEPVGHSRTEVRPARRARSTAGPMASMTAFTSSTVDVWPREKRSEPRARAASAPMASRTWDGSATPDEHADPVAHS